jgi:PAS domain S-box-containing protein
MKPRREASAGETEVASALRVLHLEDVASDSELVRSILEAGGLNCDITRVQTREEFVESLDKGFDVILADYSLPSFDGMSALKIAAQRSSDIPFIFVSGLLGEEIAIEALRTGATDYVLKGRLSGLVPSVQRSLRESRERMERMRAEKAARAANARLEGILDIALDAIISVDSHQSIILFNQGAEKVFGYTQAEVIGRPLDMLLPQRFEDVHRKHIETFARSQDLARVMGQRRAVSGRRKNGGEFPADASISKLELGGELVFTVILRDVTEQKRAEEALRQSEEQWRAAYSSNPTMYFIVDTAGIMLSVNDFGAEQLGYAPSDLIGQPVLNIFLEEDRKRVQGNAETCFQNPGRRLRWEARKVHKDGTMLWVRETANAVLLKNQPVLLIVCEDITERKHAEEALRASEERFRTFVNHASDAFMLHDNNGTILDVNRQACESLGYSRDELIGMTSLDFDPDVSPAMREGIRARLDTGKSLSFETRHRRKDGSVFPVEVRVRAFRDAECTYFISLSRDITDRKRAEAQRLDLEERLRQAEKLEAIGRLASGIAHDFNNVLGGIMAYGEMLLDEAPDGTPRKRHAQNVLTAAGRGRELVDQILGYSRSQRAKHVPIDVCGAVAETLELLRTSVPAPVTLKASIPESPLIVIGHATQFHQVLTNLCSNAIQAMSTGGTLRVVVTAIVVVAERALSHASLTPGRYACLRVEDTGIGMDSATLARIFEPFFTTKQAGRGTGLGLALVYAIVTDLDGAVDVTSAPGEGSTFSIYLPLVSVAS